MELQPTKRVTLAAIMQHLKVSTNEKPRKIKRKKFGTVAA